MEKQYPIGGYAPGNYYRNCFHCGKQFMGDKEAFQCEPCAIADKEAYDALNNEERAEHDKRFQEAVKAVFNQFNL